VAGQEEEEEKHFASRNKPLTYLKGLFLLAKNLSY